MAVVAAASNIPLAFYDKLSPMITNIFPDFKLASKYHSVSTKATCMLNGSVASTLKSELLNKMRVQPFSIRVDGFNDRELQTINPVIVHDDMNSHVVTQFLDMFYHQGLLQHICIMSLMESLHSYLNVKTLGTRALLLALTTLPVNIEFSEVKDNKKESFCLFL